MRKGIVLVAVALMLCYAQCAVTCTLEASQSVPACHHHSDSKACSHHLVIADLTAGSANHLPDLPVQIAPVPLGGSPIVVEMANDRETAPSPPGLAAVFSTVLRI